MAVQLVLLADCSLSDREKSELENEYLLSFPLEERRSWQELIAEDFVAEVYVIFEGKRLVGLISLWHLEGYLFVEHFYIFTQHRGKGLGKVAIRTLLHRYADMPILLEWELAYTSSLAQRRLDFYRRLGFKLQDIDYLQPPYDKVSPMLPLHLLATQELGSSALEGIRQLIYRDVYRWEC